MTKKYIVSLTASERKKLLKMLRSGEYKSREITRARTLLCSDEGKSDGEIGKQLHISWTTARNIRQRYHEGGIERALYDADRPGQPKKLSVKEEARVVAIACTEPPSGCSRWTLDLIAKEMSTKKKKVSRDIVYGVLLKNELKPWREKNVVHTED